jgi:hypothetical protein
MMYYIVSTTVLIDGDERDEKQLWFLCFKDGTIFTFYGKACSLRDVRHVSTGVWESIAEECAKPIDTARTFVFERIASKTLFSYVYDPRDIVEVEIMQGYGFLVVSEQMRNNTHMYADSTAIKEFKKYSKMLM